MTPGDRPSEGQPAEAAGGPGARAGREGRYTLNDLAEMLGVDKKTLRGLQTRGVLPRIQGEDVRCFTEEDLRTVRRLRELIEEQRVNPLMALFWLRTERAARSGIPRSRG